MNKNSLLILTISLIFLFGNLIGCAPSKFEPYKPPTIEFDETKKYDPDLSNLSKPKKPDFIFLDKNFEVVDNINEAEYAALNKNNLDKILQLSKKYNIQQDIIKDQIDLVNLRINQINSLKELYNIQEMQTNEYISLYTDSRNQYLQERYENKMNEFINNTFMYIITVGSIVIAILAL
jgi:hypothetical protein